MFGEESMTDFTQGMLIGVVYHAFAIAIGFGMTYLGYKLFRVGVYEKAGELKAVWGEKHLTLKQAAPGTFFGLFGAVVIGVALVQGVHMTQDYSSGKVDASALPSGSVDASDPAATAAQRASTEGSVPGASKD